MVPRYLVIQLILFIIRNNDNRCIRKRFDEGEYNKICHDIYALGVLKSFFNNQ